MFASLSERLITGFETSFLSLALILLVDKITIRTHTASYDVEILICVHLLIHGQLLSVFVISLNPIPCIYKKAVYKY